jgi:hypothetical protein
MDELDDGRHHSARVTAFHPLGGTGKIPGEYISCLI